ncbi:MAG: hypothetical protein KF745_11915 [Phycisphaeraceae bacterium]|nr:hypothetical protein [Phycisphaeraceae bacterium]
MVTAPDSPITPTPDPEQPAWRISYEFSETDLQHLYAQYFDDAHAVNVHSPSPTDRLVIKWSLAAVLVALLAMLIAYVAGWYPPAFVVIFCFMVFSLVAFASFASIHADSRKAPKTTVDESLRQFLASERVEILLGPRTLEVWSEGVLDECLAASMLVRWSAVGEVSLSDEFVCISTRLGLGILIPLHAFRDRDHAAAFVYHLNTQLSAHRAGYAERVLAHLAATDHDCPRCGYNLRGSPSLQCAECGRVLEWRDVPEAFRRRTPAAT